MTIIQTILLGIVQGITEFVPVSSSGHLVIAQDVLNANTTLVFDVALHAGTLLALLLFFYKDFYKIIKGVFVKSESTKTAKLLIVATIPAAIAGFLLESTVESIFRSSLLVAINLIAVAFIMLLVEKYYVSRKTSIEFKKITFKQALIVGVTQVAALFPGVSRSGSTIIAGMASGMKRVAALRFSFLLSAPIIFGALLKTMLLDNGFSELSSQPVVFATGILSAFVSGFLAIRFLMKYLSNHSLAVFAYYRIIVGVLIIFWVIAR